MRSGCVHLRRVLGFTRFSKALCTTGGKVLVVALRQSKSRSNEVMYIGLEWTRHTFTVQQKQFSGKQHGLQLLSHVIEAQVSRVNRLMPSEYCSVKSGTLRRHRY